MAGAVAELEALLADLVRVLGADHPGTLAARGNLAAGGGRPGMWPSWRRCSRTWPTVKVAVTGRHLVRRYQLLGVVGMSRIRWKAAVGIG